MAFLAVQGTPDKPLIGRRGGRQLDTGYGAPAERGYGAPSEPIEEVIDLRSEETLPAYEEEPLETYGDLDGAASEAREADAGLDMLMKSVPGIPGEDYPIYSEAPETAFACEGQVNGGNKSIHFLLLALALLLLTRSTTYFMYVNICFRLLC